MDANAILILSDSDVERMLATLPEMVTCEPAVYCEEAVHDWLRAHPGDLLRLRPWPEMGAWVGECPGCMTSLCVEVGQ